MDGDMSIQAGFVPTSIWTPQKKNLIHRERDELLQIS